ncbi:vacuolar protein sorting-associated protein 37A [Stegostoma tigrinum]|uniref:vacuolar protein sorting-associated protein 37A n=1 Tax=Stegostoma tigrinum TaxID=3053191 RepID=UPI00202AC98E|nr:vacuolar protein sorting-associated protein 37A [Stegostoma tigrinum]XP_048385616.1 vacuolar protein sorting-associated protein 37A [Stegostoma tigrinum]
MNWIFPSSKGSGGGSGHLPPLTSLQQQRQRQIESVKSSHNSIVEIQKDVEYRLPLTVNNKTINLNILLPPQFPQEKPVITVFPPVRHHLVDLHSATYVKSPLITNFTMHSDLGKIIQTILEEFWKSPPVLVSSSASLPYRFSGPAPVAPYSPQGYPFIAPYPTQESTVPCLPDSVTGPGFSSSRPAAPAYGLITDLPLPVPSADSSEQLGLNGHSYKMPDLPDYFAELHELSTTQLTDLNENEVLLLEHFISLPLLKQICTDKDNLINYIEELAKKNLQLEPKLEAERQELLDKYDQLTQLRSNFEKKLQRQHELSESCSFNALQARLKVAAHQAEEESDVIADEFLEGKVEIDDFLSSFMEKRTLCHCRRAKEEKLQHLMTQHGQFLSQ